MSSSQSLGKYCQLKTRTRKRQNMQKNMKQLNTIKVTLVSIKNTQKKPRIRHRTGIAWFSCILQHLARKLTRSSLSTPDSGAQTQSLAAC